MFADLDFFGCNEMDRELPHDMDGFSSPIGFPSLNDDMDFSSLEFTRTLSYDGFPDFDIRTSPQEPYDDIERSIDLCFLPSWKTSPIMEKPAELKRKTRTNVQAKATVLKPFLIHPMNLLLSAEMSVRILNDTFRKRTTGESYDILPETRLQLP